jgi:2-polyprenyl-3-methyl-5-hydroxy-6-metoxy-1,4-benzoquinol methylase
MSLGEWLMKRAYQRAKGDPARVPWHEARLPALLTRALEELAPGARVLDLGCGAGALSIALARRGLAVTGVDLFPRAIDMARAAADEAGVNVTWVATDLFEYQPSEPFDLVFDRGCLQSLVRGQARTYKARVSRFLAPRGVFVLEHWQRTGLLDWRPIGPRRRTVAELTDLFAPELRLVEHETHAFWARLPHGPRARLGRFRFVRAG